MSRIGRIPVAVPAGATVIIAGGNEVIVKGPKGTLEREFLVEMTIGQKDDQIVVNRPSGLEKMKSLHGLAGTLVNNMIHGVTEGYEKVFEISGVGYRTTRQGKKLTSSLGYSRSVEMGDPRGIETATRGQDKIIVKGISKEKVGQCATGIGDKRRSEPYENKGIKHADEVIRRKIGKTGKK